MAVKKKAHEKLDDANIQHVINLLDGEKPITKKEACGILNIANNSTRLAKIISEFEDKKDYREKMRARNKGKPVTETEKREIVQGLLQGESYSQIAKGLFRSPSLVKSTALRLGVPQKATGDEKKSTGLLPEECISETFEPDERVWSAVHHSPGIVQCELDGPYGEKYGCRAYRIYILERGDFSDSFFPGVETGGYAANLPAYDIGNLRHLENLKIRWDLL